MNCDWSVIMFNKPNYMLNIEYRRQFLTFDYNLWLSFRIVQLRTAQNGKKVFRYKKSVTSAPSAVYHAAVWTCILLCLGLRTKWRPSSPSWKTLFLSAWGVRSDGRPELETVYSLQVRYRSVDFISPRTTDRRLQTVQNTKLNIYNVSQSMQVLRSFNYFNYCCVFSLWYCFSVIELVFLFVWLLSSEYYLESSHACCWRWHYC